MKTIEASQNGWTIIGRQGENGRTLVRFSKSAEIFREYPGATFTLMHRRHGDAGAYPVDPALVSVDEDGVVQWLIVDSDLATAGRGMAELIFREGDTVVCEMIYTTQILPSLNPGSVPEPWEGWVERLLAIIEGLEVATPAETLAYMGIPFREIVGPEYAEAVETATEDEMAEYLNN